MDINNLDQNIYAGGNMKRKGNLYQEIYKFENDGNLSNEKTKEIMSELDDFLRKQNS